MKPAIARKLPIDDVDWMGLMAIASEANRAVARFDGMLGHMTVPHLLQTPLMTREAVLSSRIEGTLATISDVYRFEAGTQPAEDAKRLDIEEIVNYRRALEAAKRELKTRPFSLNLLLKMHRILLTSVRGHNKAPGAFRRVQNYLGRPGDTIEQATFVPPSPERLMAGLDNWERYYHAEERDPLVQLAIVHAQFEFLHPFLDGNGRIGRILIPLFLYEKGILSTPNFYLSEYLEEHRDEYLDRLGDLHRGGEAWTRWCLFFLRAITVQSSWNVHRAQGIVRLYNKLRVQVQTISRSSAVLPLLDAMFLQPMFTATTLLRVAGAPKRPQLMRLLERLAAEDVVRIAIPASGRKPALYSLHQAVKLAESRPPRETPKS